jgi:flagellar protein FliO/FliZ
MVELTVRIVFSLLIVLGLMWGLARFLHRPLRGKRGGLVAVLGRQQLSKGACVAVVRVVDRAMVLGVTDGQVTLLGEADLSAVEQYQPEQPVHRQAVPLAQLPGLDAGTTATLTAATAGAAGAGAAAAKSPVGLIESGSGRLAGSLLSPSTWSQTLRVVRERTGRRP